MKRLFPLLLATLAASLPQWAQTTSSSALQPPSLPVMLSYEYWPQQFVQFLGTELPYSMIQLGENATGKTPVYDLILTEQSSGRRIHYTNNDDVLLSAKATGSEAHKVEIRFQSDDAASTGSVSMLRLTLADGQPLIWRFVQGSDVSERGSGMLPLPQMPLPTLAYREEGAVAGEGTALQIGQTTSAAAVWKEMSQPPYFIAYHGAYTVNAQRLVFLQGDQKWTVLSAPTSLAPGQAWELESPGGLHRTLRVESITGNEVVLSGSEQSDRFVHFAVSATYAAGVWKVESIRYSPVKEGDKHYIDVRFQPAIAPDAKQVELEITAGKKTLLATAVIALSGPAEDRVGSLAFKKPDWLSKKSITVETKNSTTAIEQIAKL